MSDSLKSILVSEPEIQKYGFRSYATYKLTSSILCSTLLVPRLSWWQLVNILTLIRTSQMILMKPL